MGLWKPIVEPEKGKLAYKNHQEGRHIQGLISTSKNYIDKRKAEEEHVQHHPQDPFETLWVLTSHKEVEERDNPEFYSHEKQYQVLQQEHYSQNPCQDQHISILHEELEKDKE